MHSARQMKILFANAFRRLPTILPALCFSLLCSSAAAQVQHSGTGRAIPPADSKLIEVKDTGSKRFTQEQVAAASGLPLGATVDDETFRKAARQLGETGAFNAISYSFSYSSAGAKGTFQVTDADKFVPAHFAAFVWLFDHDTPPRIHD